MILRTFLRGLGYRNNNMLAQDVEAKLAEWDSKLNPPQEDTAKDAVESNPSEPEAEVTEGQEAKVEVVEVETDASVSTADINAKKSEEPVEEKRIDVWRQNREDRPATRGKGRPDHRQKGGQRTDNKKRDGSKSGGRPHGKDFKKGGGKRENAKRPVDKPIDPDSPFAALLALKDGMKDKK